MLVLTRTLRESMIVGEGASAHLELTVTVLEIHGDRVRPGIEAHRDVKVYRWEVWERICQAAAQIVGSSNLRATTTAPLTPELNGFDRAVARADALKLREVTATED